MFDHMCDWSCGNCGEVQPHPIQAHLVVCECGSRCHRLKPEGSAGLSRRRSFDLAPRSVKLRGGNGVAVSTGEQLFFGGMAR